MKNETGLRREYGGLETKSLEVAMSGSLLASSALVHTNIESVGQEVGVVYNLSATDGIDTNTGKTFAHEWEEGTN